MPKAGRYRLQMTALALVLTGAAAVAQDPAEGPPLSAIDWLSDSVDPVSAAGPTTGPTLHIPPALPDEEPVADSASVPDVTVTALDQPSPDRIGLLSPAQTGLPATLWSGSAEADVVTLVQAQRSETLPAIQSFLTMLMLAEAEPPFGAGPDGALFLARVDKLLDFGTLDPALELLTAATPETPALFRRYFDVALLTGTEGRACRLLTSKPEVAPTLQARMFCLARSGDWTAAALTLNTAVALGDVSDEEEALLSRFLDPELYEGEPRLPLPDRMTPLVFRMHEAIGEGVSASGLPRAFAHADLRDTMGWKTRIEAAERLTRAGAIPEVQLFELYTLQRPAASGGVWDRAEAFQTLEAALETGEDLEAAVLGAWDAARGARIEVPFATRYGPEIRGLELSGRAGSAALTIGLLSPDYELVALDRAGANPRQDLLLRIARGDAGDFAPVTGELDYPEAMIRDAFGAASPPPALTAMAEEGKLGEALLRAAALFTEGSQGDLMSARDAVLFFRSVGLEDLARRAALQLLILDRSP